MSKNKPNPTKKKARYDLPPDFLTEIGKSIVAWAYFENLVQQMIQYQLGLSHAEARLALREPRVTDRLDLLRDLMTLHDGKWNDELFASISGRTKTWVARRHLFAHSFWACDEKTGTWTIQKTGGKWPDDWAKLFKGQRRVMPAAVVITITHLQNATKAIYQLIEDLETLRASADWTREPLP